MSDGMNPEQIAEVFKSLGRIETNTLNTAETLKSHIADDKATVVALFGRIETLQMGQARQKGFLSALTAVGSVLGAGVGYIVEKLTFGSH